MQHQKGTDTLTETLLFTSKARVVLLYLTLATGIGKRTYTSEIQCNDVFSQEQKSA